MQNLRTQITESQKLRSDLMKWKLVLASGVGSAGLGLGSVKFPQAHLLLCLLPMISVYVDSLCAHLSLRIKAIGEFISSIEPEGRSEVILREYERFLRKNPPLFKLETIALHWSTIFLSAIVAGYGYAYSSPDEIVRFPLIGNCVTSTLFYVSGSLGTLLTVCIQLFFRRRTKVLAKSSEKQTFLSGNGPLTPSTMPSIDVCAEQLNPADAKNRAAD